MNLDFLDFEQPIAELEAKIDELRHVGSDAEINIQDELATLENKSRDLTESIFSNLKPWQISQVARHPLRPYFLDYVKRIFDDFEEMHGDRAYADDQAVVSGIARLEGMPVAIIGHQKGRDTKEKLHRNFGMPRPEGYRKALRIMETAERFKLPILTFIDTPGAYPGVGAEERGQSEAIARNLREMSILKTPIISTVIGRPTEMPGSQPWAGRSEGARLMRPPDRRRASAATPAPSRPSGGRPASASCSTRVPR